MKLVKLGDVAHFVRGITFKPADKVEPFSSDSVVCFRTKNVQRDVDLSDLIAVPPRFVKRDEQYLTEGDILVSTANSWNLVGKCCWVPKLEYKTTLGGFISALRPNASAIEPRYLYHWFNSPRTQLLARHCGRQTTNISNMDLKRALKLEIPLPPMEEQRRIAAILDKADALRRLRRTALAKLDTLLQSTFLHMFGDPVTNPMGWPTSTLGEIINFRGGSQPAKKFFTTERQEDSVRLVQIRDFKSDRFITYAPRSLCKRFFETDDVMIARYGPPVFQILRGMSGAYNVALMKAMPRTPAISKDFIFYLLQSPNLHSFVVLNSQRTAGQTGVNLRLLNGYPAYIPPLNLQKQFSTLVASYTEQLNRYRASETDLNSLFNSLQQKAFRSEL